MTHPDDEAHALMRKAHRALDDARFLLENDRAEAAVNRMYYAVFDAARAALLTEMGPADDLLRDVEQFLQVIEARVLF